MLPATLRGNVGDGILEYLQKSLLDTLAGDVAGDGDIVRLPGNLVDFIDVDNPDFRLGNVVVGGLDEPEEDVLDILAHISRLGEGRRIRDCKGNLQLAGEGLRQKGLPAAGGTNHEDVALDELDVVLRPRLLCVLLLVEDALVVVVDCDGEGLLRLLLPVAVEAEEVVDFPGCAQTLAGDSLGRLRQAHRLVMPHHSGKRVDGGEERLLHRTLELRRNVVGPADVFSRDGDHLLDDDGPVGGPHGPEKHVAALQADQGKPLLAETQVNPEFMLVVVEPAEHADARLLADGFCRLAWHGGYLLLRRGLRLQGNDRVNHVVFSGLLGGHEEVTLGILGNLLRALPNVL